MEEDWRIMDVKEEVVGCGFLEVSQDVHQLCTACLCATRTTRTLDDDALKQYYMHILTEMQPEGGVVVLQSPRVCWECESHLKKVVHFREQVQDSYRLLQPMLSMCDQEDLDEFLQTSVRRSGRLNNCFAYCIDIAPQDDHYQDYDIIKLQENDAHTKTEVKYDIKPRNTLNTTFVCDYCYKRFASKAALERHIATYNIYPNNNKTVPSPCEDCVVVLCSDDQCSECPDKHYLLQHYNIKTNITKVQYQCKMCHKAFPFKSKLMRHIRTHTGEKPYQCEVCHKSFSEKGKLVTHLRTHSGEKPYQCEVCHKSFSEKGNLVTHLRTHTGEKPYQCEVCHKSFSGKGTLVKHIRTHTGHSGQKRFQCEACHQSFSFKSNLRRHVATHTGQKPIQCKICHKSFSRKDHLLSHLRSHTGEKPNYCEVCGKYFSSKPNLRQHMRTHTGVNLFQCEVCHKSFCAKYNLQVHLRTHTDERPYQCEVCHNCFRHRSAWVKHTQTRICEKSLRTLDILSKGV